MKFDTSDITVEQEDVQQQIEEISEDSEQAGIQYLKAKIRELEAETENTKNDTELKKDLANKTFSYMKLVGNFVAVIVMFYVATLVGSGKEIPKEFMIALVTTTLATVVGLVGFILKGLFGSNK